MTSMPRVVLAPDKFKGSLTAPRVAAALATGITRRAPGTEIRQVPVADGGEGTVDAFLAAGWKRVELTAPGPTGKPGLTAYAVRGLTAVIELASVVGLAKLPGGQPDPCATGTEGLGVVIAHALDHGATDIVLGLGGSASTDGGAGMLRALGARILDAGGREIPSGGAALAAAVRIDPTELHPGIAAATFTLASDVDNPLLGPAGTVAVYAPQKGANQQDCAILEAALTNWARVAGPGYADLPGAGAAGGTGFGALAVLRAQVRSGIKVILDLLDFTAQLDGATLVVTGEGSLDRQSRHGKAPIGVCEAARKAGLPVVAAVGRSGLARDELTAAGFTACYSLADLEPDPARSIARAAPLLEQVGEQIALHAVG